MLLALSLALFELWHYGCKFYSMILRSLYVHHWLLMSWLDDWHTLAKVWSVSRIWRRIEIALARLVYPLDVHRENLSRCMCLILFVFYQSRLVSLLDALVRRFVWVNLVFWDLFQCFLFVVWARFLVLGSIWWIRIVEFQSVF